jgi:hypothetical protein
MPRILKEYKCPGHGFFESFEPRCPKGGCTTVEQVYLTPVGLRSDKTKFTDKTARQLAMDFGLGDISSRPGEPARIKSRAVMQAQQQQQDFRARFGALPKGGIQQALKQYGAPATNAMAEVKDTLPNFKRAVTYTRDPDRDSAAKVRAA